MPLYCSRQPHLPQRSIAIRGERTLKLRHSKPSSLSFRSGADLGELNSPASTIPWSVGFIIVKSEMLNALDRILQAVANILSNYGVDHLPTLMAAILHDTVEDTDTTLQEIATLFGDDVASIVEVSRIVGMPRQPTL